MRATPSGAPACGRRLDYTARLPGPSGRLELPRLRTHAGRGSTLRPTRSSSQGLDGTAGSSCARRSASAPVRLPCRASTTSTTRSPRPRRRVPRRRRRWSGSCRAWSGSTPPSAASSGCIVDDRDAVLLLVKNPAGANELIRTLDRRRAAQAAAAGAERPHRRRPRRLVDLGRRLRAVLRSASQQVVPTGTRAAEMAMRLKYCGSSPVTGWRSSPTHRRGARPAGRGRGARVSARHLHGDARAARHALAERGVVRPYWEAA